MFPPRINVFDLSHEPITVRVNKLKIPETEKQQMFQEIVDFANRNLATYIREYNEMQKQKNNS